MTLPNKTALGSTESVVNVLQTDEADPATPIVIQVTDGSPRAQLDKADGRSSVVEQWDPPVDISHLSMDQQTMVKEMLREESGAFGRDDNEMGCITGLEMSITLNDNTPIQKSYTSIPKPLYK